MDRFAPLLPLLRRIDPERAHRIGLAGLRWGLAGRAAAPAMLATEALGLRFASPIGLAAGFDKNAEAVGPLLRLGFGFVEIGTVTPLPQPGNERPRLFRLPADRAVINRMGFNGEGAERVAARLAGWRDAGAGARAGAEGRDRDSHRDWAGPVGVNLGINKTGAAPVRDYAALVRRFATLADYLVINVSSPNTPGLRDLQGERALTDILAALPAQRPKLLVKLAPDLADAALAPVIECCLAAGVDGLVIANTTIGRRAGLSGRHAGEPGGLSGPPLFARSTAMLARAALLANGRLTLIGAGGVSDGGEVLTKLKAGASLVQLYTAFAYGGPGLIGRLHRELAAALRAEGFASPAAAVGAAAGRLAELDR